jgi:hypothetical protein
MSVRLIRRVVGLAGVAVLVAGMFVGAAAPAAAHPGMPSARFDPNTVSWASYRNYTLNDFNAVITQQRAAGLMLIDIDVDADQGFCTCLYGGAFQRNLDGRDWFVVHNITEPGLRQAIEEFRTLNMRLVDFEPYVVGDQRRWSGLWIENVEGYAWNAVVSTTSGGVRLFSDNERAAGRLIVDVDGVRAGSGALYSAISVRNAENLAWTLGLDVTSDEFHLLFEALRQTHRPLVADSTNTNAGQRFSGVWLENRNGRGRAIWRNLTIDQWAQKWQEERDAGRRVINFERYETANGARYLGIWRQNN